MNPHVKWTNLLFLFNILKFIFPLDQQNDDILIRSGAPTRGNSIGFYLVQIRQFL